jgi:hypothetical protein
MCGVENQNKKQYNSPDLQHRDWLLATTVKMVQSVDS